MIILVTGDKGFIARHLIDKLKKEHEVHGYDYNENHKPALDGYDWVIHRAPVNNTEETKTIISWNMDISIED